MTVAELFDEWLDHHVRVNCSPAHLEDSRIQYRLRIGPMIGHRRIDTVNRRIVRQMIAQMQRVMRERDPGNENAGHRTINKTLTVVKGMLSYAVQIDQLETNPAHGVPALVEAPTRPIDAWPLEVIHAVANAARDLAPAEGERGTSWAGERDYAIIMLATLTGLRQSEVLGLRWDRIDGDWLHVTHKLCRRSFTLRQPKSRRGERRVPLLGFVGTPSLPSSAWRSITCSESWSGGTTCGHSCESVASVSSGASPRSEPPRNRPE